VTETMFSTRQVPWMKLGQLHEGVKTAAEAAQLSGLNFEVEKRPVQWVDETGIAHPVADRRALVRKDTGQWLSIMSTDYPILQFGEAFDFMDGVNPNFVAAGTLKDGKQGFMVVEGPEIDVLDGDDPHELFAVLRTSHDGSRAVEVSVMPLRNRCMNQLTLNNFTLGAQCRWSVKHTTSMKSKLTDAHLALQRLDKYAEDYTNTVEKLVDIKLSGNQAENILMTVLPERPKRDDQVTAIIDRWHTAETVGNQFDWTGWGLLNAVSDYFDWGRTGGSAESRFTGALQGATHQAINRTAQVLLHV
jgi:phage/plasmid-like protein (TIGR03299 family)